MSTHLEILNENTNENKKLTYSGSIYLLKLSLINKNKIKL